MGKEIVCLLVYNISVAPRMSKLLLRLACEMLHRRQKKRSFDSTELKCEGSISTKFQRAYLGHFSGTVFEANLETNRGKARVQFLVDDRDPVDLMSTDEDELFVYSGSDHEPDKDSYLHN